jgi:glutamine synthetase
MVLGSTLPTFNKDNSDRNRTSPFAFTGNKFEFRMLGSSFSVADPNIVLNTAVAEVLDGFACEIEKAKDKDKAIDKIIVKTIRNHRRIIFNGNGYSEQWIKEAESRGLLNIGNTVDSIPCLTADKNVRLFEKYGVFTRHELEARSEIMLEGYSKTIRIEALTTAEIAKKNIYHAVNGCIATMCNNIALRRDVLPAADTSIETDIASRLAALNSKMMAHVSALEAHLAAVSEITNVFECAKYYRENVFEEMQNIRVAADEMETLCDASVWPLPTYGELLYSIK